MVSGWWAAANYLTVAQIYLQDNPLLREPLRPEHIKPRLLGHWGTSPGLNLIYAHLNRLIRHTDQDVLYVTGPGHGGPAFIANVYLEGSYSEVYPEVSLDIDGLRRLVRQFSTPGGIPSHVSVNAPGSIHEGASSVRARARVRRRLRPSRSSRRVRGGDGEAETGPLEGSWKGTRFLNPARDGAVLPILHLNEAKISGPTVLGRAPEEDLMRLLTGHGYDPLVVQGAIPSRCTARSQRRSPGPTPRSARSKTMRGTTGTPRRPSWPAIVLRTPKGWTGPKQVDGKPVEGTFRAHQVPISGPGEPRSTSHSSSSGCGATVPTNCSTPAVS